jgi:hypothetical protein
MKLVYSLNMTKTISVQLTMYSVVAFFLAAGLFESITNHTSGDIGSPVEALISLAVYASTLIIHELLHGLGFKLFGGNPTYGAGVVGILPYFYATSDNDRFRIWQMYIIGLAPLFVISLGTVIGTLVLPQFVNYFAVAFIGNFAGAVGDLWLMAQITRFAKYSNVMVEDRKNGLDIYSSDLKALTFGSALATSQKQNSFIKHWIWGAMALALAVFCITFFGPVFHKTLLIGPGAFPLVAYTVTEKSAEFTFNPFAPILGGLLFALILRLFRR